MDAKKLSRIQALRAGHNSGKTLTTSEQEEFRKLSQEARAEQAEAQKALSGAGYVSVEHALADLLSRVTKLEG